MKIGYARACKYDRDDLNVQIAALTDAGCKKVYSEVVDAVTSPRPQLKVCLAELKPRDVLVVNSLERLGRSIDNIIQILEDLHGREVSFQSLGDGVTVRGAAGEAVISMLQSLSNFKAEVYRIRKVEAEGNGVKTGRKKGSVNKKNQGKPEMCKQLYENGTPVGKIMKLLNIRSYATVNRYLEQTGAVHPDSAAEDLFSPRRLRKEELQELKKQLYDKNHQLELFSE